MQRILPEGYVVKYRHAIGRSGVGGRTWAKVFDGDGNEVAAGMAVCSLQDQYSRHIGRLISLGRALKKLEDA